MSRFNSYITGIGLTMLSFGSNAFAFQPGYPPQPMYYNYAQPQFVQPPMPYRAAPIAPPARFYAPMPMPQPQWQPQWRQPPVAYRAYAPWSPQQQPKAAQKPKAPNKQLSKPAPAEKKVVKVDKPAKSSAKQKPLTKGDSKQAFLQKLEPIIESENVRLLEQRSAVIAVLDKLEKQAVLSDDEKAFIKRMDHAYRVDGNPLLSASARQELLNKVDIIPTSLALAQAVNESAWGTSRFAVEGKNLFGIWTYDESKGIVPKNRSEGQKHLVRKFDSLAESVRYYMFNLNSHPAYAELRAMRAEQRAKGQKPDSMILAGGLIRYSAKGEEYVRLIRDIINRYNLASLDTESRNRA